MPLMHTIRIIHSHPSTELTGRFLSFTKETFYKENQLKKTRWKPPEPSTAKSIEALTVSLSS